MNFALYRELLAVAPVRRLLLVAMIARFPHSAAGVILTLHVVQTLQLGYTQAGAVAAVLTIGIAAGAPWRGRRVDTVGLRRALIPSVVSEAVIWAVAPQLPFPGLVAAAFVGGLLTLPVFSVVRQSLGVMTPAAQRRTAFALDAIGTEVTFMAGPAVGVLLATSLSTPAALLIVGLATASAGLFLMWFNPPTRSGQPGAVAAADDPAGSDPVPGPPAPAEVAEPGAAVPGRAARLRGSGPGGYAWLTPAVVLTLAVAAGAGMLLSGTDVGIVAVLRGHGQMGELGIVFFFWCAASVVGGLLYGAMHRRVHPLYLLLLMGLLSIPMGFASDTLTLSLLSILPGLLCAPVLSSASERIALLVAEDRRGEAMGWYGSALTAGTALGAPGAGAAIDWLGPWAGFSAVGTASVLLCTGALLLKHRLNVQRRPAGLR